MKKVVPFTKTIHFKTLLKEITDIEVTHNLMLKNMDEVEGDILVDGKYKITDASIVEEEFHYKLPFVIAIDSKYDTENLDINIDNFNYEIINEEDLKLDVEIGLDNLEEIDILDEKKEIKIPVEIEEEKVEVLEEDNNISNVFSNLTTSEETFSTYHVYIVRESDTIESIIDKYNISREELALYNDLDNIGVDTKLIIPCSNE